MNFRKYKIKRASHEYDLIFHLIYYIYIHTLGQNIGAMIMNIGIDSSYSGMDTEVYAETDSLGICI